MTKVKRQIITINEEKCDGCGLCVPSCVEGALQIVDGKARLVKESFCDGLGACLGECPRGALSVSELEVEAYREEDVIARLQQAAPEQLEKHLAHVKSQRRATIPLHPPADATPCPSLPTAHWEEAEEAMPTGSRMRSELRQWPVQLYLVPLQAPFFQNADLFLIADCVPFAYPNFHADFLKEHAVAVGCPKLDDGRGYIAKLTQILCSNDVRSLTVVRMEVPCCGGLVFIAQQALTNSGKDIPFETVVIRISG